MWFNGVHCRRGMLSYHLATWNFLSASRPRRSTILGLGQLGSSVQFCHQPNVSTWASYSVSSSIKKLMSVMPFSPDILAWSPLNLLLLYRSEVAGESCYTRSLCRQQKAKQRLWELHTGVIKEGDMEIPGLHQYLALPQTLWETLYTCPFPGCWMASPMFGWGMPYICVRLWTV